MSFLSPVFIEDPLTSKRIEVIIHNEIVERQMQQENALKEILKDFPAVDLYVAFEVYGSVDNETFLKKRTLLQEVMPFFDHCSPINAHRFSSNELFILLAASAFWSEQSTEQVKTALRREALSQQGPNFIEANNYRIFFLHFPWGTFTPIEQERLALAAQNLLCLQLFHVFLADPLKTVQFISLRFLYKFMKEGYLTKEIEEAVDNEVKRRISSRPVTETGGINPTNYLLFKRYVFDHALESKIRLSCFFSEECKRNWELLQSTERFDRILRITVASLLRNDLKTEFTDISNKQIDELAVRYYKEPELCEKIAIGIGNLRFEVQALDFYRLEHFLNCISKKNLSSPSATLRFLEDYVRNFLQRAKDDYYLQELFGDRLNRELTIELAKLLAEFNLSFRNTSELTKEYHFLRTVKEIIFSLDTLPETEINSTMRGITDYLKKFFQEYPTPYIYDPKLSEDLHNREKMRSFIKIVRATPSFLKVALKIFKIDFSNF